MQFVNMDVVRHDSKGQTTDSRRHFGPLSPGLNAIYGPPGSGKGQLLAWLRGLVNGELRNSGIAPAAMSGGLEIEQHGRRYLLRSGQGGFSQDESVDSGLPRANPRSGLSARQQEAFACLTEPATADYDAALHALGNRLINGVANHSLTTANRQTLLDHKRDLESRLAQLQNLQATRDSLLSRRTALQAEMLQAEQERKSRQLYAETQHNSQRYAEIESELRDTLAQIEEIDRQLDSLRAKLPTAETSRNAVSIDASHREQLQQIDDRLGRWRQTLRDLKAHREHIDHEATDARLDQQVGDQLSATKQADPRSALRSLESQIASARSQLDVLVDRFSVLGNTIEPSSHRLRSDQQSYTVHRDAYGQTRISYRTDGALLPASSSLPETLRCMQRDLNEACQQLSRHEATAASETLKQQSQQLKRCEAELLQSIEKLIAERASLLSRIADKYQLTHDQLALAFGTWCDCQQHPHLQDWLAQDQQTLSRVGSTVESRQQLIEQIEFNEARRKSAILQAENCRRQLREADNERHQRSLHRRPTLSREASDIQREIDAVRTELLQVEERDRLQRELEDICRQLQTLPATAHETSGDFQANVDRHIAGLMHGLKRSNSMPVAGVQRRYDPIDGIVFDNVSLASDLQTDAIVPGVLVRVAMKLAIVECLAVQGDAIPLVLLGSLDPLSHELQDSAIAYLGQIARGTHSVVSASRLVTSPAAAVQAQQIVLLTSDQHVAELVHKLHGWVASLDRPSPTEAEPDINRHLAALANDYEADKWYQPSVRPWTNRGTVRGEYYLHERSLVEDCPSIAATAANRLRALGIDRVGDLLDVDPNWLADNIRLEGISRGTISRWQAEARLLCSVRQLRPFDARLLVGVGIRNPKQLSEMHPSELLERVEQFVTTDRGRRILRSGSRYELERITTWIASAKGGASRFQRSSLSDDVGDRTSAYDNQYAERASGDLDAFHGERGSAAGQARDGSANQRRGSSASRNGSSRSERNRSRRSSSRRSSAYPVVGRQESMGGSDREARRTSKRQRRERRRSESLKLANSPTAQETTPRRKFYLETSSPVVDAPSIGPRMSARLERIGIHTVDQLLAANAETLAAKLNVRRAPAEKVRAWQEQARLVCRIPNLRGHDAQLLVASNLTSPEELAAMEPASVLADVLVIANSSEGQRILRGSQLPDLAEVTDWIHWAAHCRTLNAA